MAKIVDAVSSGRITPREAADIAQLVSAFTQAIDASDAEVEIDRLKSKLDGGGVCVSTVSIVCTTHDLLLILWRPQGST